MSSSEIEDAVRAHEPAIAEKFIAAALVETERRPELLQCYPPSFVASVAISERVGIPVDSRVGAAYLSVQRGRKKECVFLPGYPAFAVAAKQADPEILFTDAQLVRERDDFRFEHTTAPVFTIPSRPRVSKLLQGLATLAGVAPVDGFRHVPYVGSDAGGIVAVYAYAVYRSGVVKRVLLRRDELDSIPEKEWGTDKGQWKLRGRALRTLAKTLVRTPEMGALIYLARGDEDADYTPRSLDVCRTLGVTVYEQPEEFRGEASTHARSGGPEAPSRSQPKAPSPDVPASSGPPDFLDEIIEKRTKQNPEFPKLVEEAAKKRAAQSEFDAALQRVANDQKPSGDNPLKLRCCGCGNVEQVFRSKVFALAADLSDTCKTGAITRGTHHDLCGSCRDQHYAAWAGFNAHKEVKKASKRTKAAEAASAEKSSQDDSAASSKGGPKASVVADDATGRGGPDEARAVLTNTGGAA